MMTAAFLSLSILAVIAGGLLSAFTAQRASRATAWASAYLVLVVGVIQFGLLSLWQGLGQPRAELVWSALVAYNLGNLGVMIGTLLKMRPKQRQLLVNCGGGLIALAMFLLLAAVSHAAASLKLAAFIGLVVIILVSMSIGLILSGRRRK